MKKCNVCQKQIVLHEIRVRRTESKVADRVIVSEDTDHYHVKCFGENCTQLGWFQPAHQLIHFNKLSAEDQEAARQFIGNEPSPVVSSIAEAGSAATMDSVDDDDEIGLANEPLVRPPYLCNICGQLFESLGQLQQHLTWHLKPYFTALSAPPNIESERPSKSRSCKKKAVIADGGGENDRNADHDDYDVDASDGDVSVSTREWDEGGTSDKGDSSDASKSSERRRKVAKTMEKNEARRRRRQSAKLNATARGAATTVVSTVPKAPAVAPPPPSPRLNIGGGVAAETASKTSSATNTNTNLSDFAPTRKIRNKVN